MGELLLSGYLVCAGCTEKQPPALYEPSPPSLRDGGPVSSDTIPANTGGASINQCQELPKNQDSSPVNHCQENNQIPCLINAVTCQSTYPALNGHDYIIITRPKFIPSLLPFVNSRCQEHKIYLATVEQITANFKGRDTPERIRNFLKHAKANGAKYLLLVGTPDSKFVETKSLDYIVDNDWEVPMRYVSLVGKPYNGVGFPDDSVIPTDQYYASLGGSWDDNNNSVFGEAGQNDEFGFKPDLYVGRFPARTPEELAIMMKTTLGWAPKKKPVHSGFANGACEVPDYMDWSANLSRTLFKEAYDLRLHICTTDPGGDIANYLNQDVADIMSSFSHGTFGVIGRIPVGSEKSYYLYVGKSLPINKPALFFVYACETAAVDLGVDSVAEYLLKNGSSVAYIGATRSNFDNGFNFWEGVHHGHNFEIGKALAEYKLIESVSTVDAGSKWNLMMFNLFGDPSLKLYMPQVEITLPEAVDLGSSTDFVPFQAQIKNRKQYPVNVVISEKNNNPRSWTLKSVPPNSACSVNMPGYSYSKKQLSTVHEDYTMIDQDGDASFAKTKLIRYHEVVIPHHLVVNVKGGSMVNIPIKVRFGEDETIGLTIDYYSNDWSASPIQILSTKKDLSEGRSFNLQVVIPKSTTTVDPQNAVMPRLVVYCDKGVVSQQQIWLHFFE